MPEFKENLGLPLSSAIELRAIAARRLGPVQEYEHGDHQLNPDVRRWVLDRAVKPAAVLIPFVERNNEIQVILTKRTDHLTSHSGQIAFPGGKIDSGDPDAGAAALREAQEEIMLQPGLAEIIGYLPYYFTGSGYRISPVLALVENTAELKPNPQEVEYIFEVPLEFLMDPKNHRTSSRNLNGMNRYFYEMPYGEHYIWGATAGIIHMLHEKLFK